jgi:hypothetical protein
MQTFAEILSDIVLGFELEKASSLFCFDAQRRSKPATPKDASGVKGAKFMSL